MPKEELIELDGIVSKILPNSTFTVVLDNGHTITAYSSGRIRKYRIKILLNDRVTVQMTPYDITKGRIVVRHKEQKKVIDPNNK